MTKKIATKYALLVVGVITAVTLVFVPLYLYVQKQMYIRLEIEGMKKFSGELVEQTDFSRKNTLEAYMEEDDEKNYVLIIYDTDGNEVFRKWHRGEPKQSKSRTMDFFEKYSEKAVPAYHEEKGVDEERIVLRKIVKNHGKSYYLYVHKSIRNVESIFDYTNRMLLVILLLHIFVCGFSVILLMHGITKSIRDLNSVVQKLSEGNYSVRYEGKITNDEVGMLADNFNRMVDTIQDNITSIRNYNFLLKENINDIKQHEDLRNSFVRNATHELKTPLAIISSQVEMMNCTVDEEKKRYYYESTMDEIRKMSMLITNFLKYSVTEGRAFREEYTEINLSGKFKEMCEKMSQMMHVHKLSFKYQVEEGCILLFSEMHAEYIFNNFIMNAMRHTKNGGEIKVTFAKGKFGYRLSVYNDGEKIPENQIEMIWKELYSLDDENIDNVGLGLFIIKEISLIHFMDCGVENQKNGVEFWFDFVNMEKEV